uniref:Ankyrin repeat domain 2 (stretch responsive muscle) n=1 Tax=Amphilophus citrinellus TaxID=61819 RepID=A0A3Q0SXR9_AMPCI
MRRDKQESEWLNSIRSEAPGLRKGSPVFTADLKKNTVLINNFNSPITGPQSECSTSRRAAPAEKKISGVSLWDGFLPVKVNLCLSCSSVFLCGQIGPVDTAEFMNAASECKLSIIDKYLADGGNPNVCDELKRTALHRACLEGHSPAVQMLLEKGADINLNDQLGSRAIHWACRGGNLTVIEVLKNHGADVNVRDKLHSTPLHVATRTGHAIIVEYLLSCGAKINSRDREGDTALHDAVRLNRHKIVKLLVVAGADTKIKNHASVAIISFVCLWLKCYVGNPRQTILANAS